MYRSITTEIKLRLVLSLPEGEINLNTRDDMMRKIAEKVRRDMVPTVLFNGVDRLEAIETCPVSVSLTDADDGEDDYTIETKPAVDELVNILKGMLGKQAEVFLVNPDDGTLSPFGRVGGISMDFDGTEYSEALREFFGSND